MDSKPENWDFTIKGIASQIKEEYDAIKSGIDELLKFGYLTRKSYQNERGQWDTDYELYPLGDAISDKTATGSTATGKHRTGADRYRITPDLSNKEQVKKIKEEKEGVSAPAFPKLSSTDKATHKEVFDVVNELIPELSASPFQRIIVEILIKIPDWHEYALYVQKNKSERYLEVGGWRKWFYEDYLVDKHRPIDAKNTLTPEEEQRMIELGEKYGYDFTEPKEDKNKMTFDDYLLEAKVAKKYKMAGFTPHPSVAHLWDTLEVEEEKQYNFI
jgi:hypothetical protein